MKRMRWIALVLVLLSMLTLNLTTAVSAQEALVESDTPCTDRWAGCVAGGGGDNFCDGMWCGCMYSKYGYIC